MALVLEANYSKKLGLPGYSSLQYSITVRTELSDVKQMEGESKRLYVLLQTCVDREIQSKGLVEQLAMKLLGIGVRSLNKLQASGLISELTSDDSRPSAPIRNPMNKFFKDEITNANLQDGPLGQYVPKYAEDLHAEGYTRSSGHCCQTTNVGRRDYAILLLLARLGLRAIEVVRLTLDDIDGGFPRSFTGV